jgi:hypothetical protein
MHQIDAGRLWAFRYVEGIKKLKNAVRVLDVDPLYRWVLVERIIHDMKWGATGYDIALKLFPPSKDLSLPTTWIEQAQAAAKQGRAWDTKIWELLLLARENGHIPPLAEALPNVPDSLKEAWKKAHTGPKKTSENFGLLRQYVLEKDTLTWRVLDTN